MNRPLPEILILTNEQDFGADEVVRRIDRQRVAVRRLNIEHATRHPIEANPVLDGDAYSNVRAVWWRQFVPGHSTPTSIAADDLLVERAQWSAFLALFDRPDIAWVNPLWAARRAENKLVQRQWLRNSAEKLRQVDRRSVQIERTSGSPHRETLAGAVPATAKSPKSHSLQRCTPTNVPDASEGPRLPP